MPCLHTTFKCALSSTCSVDSTSAAGQKLTAMLRNITDAYKETLTLLQLEAFPAAVALFRFKGRKAIAINIAETLLENGVMVPSVEQVSCGFGWAERSGLVVEEELPCLVGAGPVQDCK